MSSWISRGYTFGFGVLLVGCSDHIGERIEPGEPLGTEQQALTCGSSCSSWVFPSHYDVNRLVYVPDREGDRIGEFGRVGYKRGRYGLPSENLPPLGPRKVDNTMPPLTGYPPEYYDDFPEDICAPGGLPHSGAIQSVLDDLGNDPPDANGMRGYLYLARGHYRITQTLTIPSGVVLRGVSEFGNSSGDPPTTLHACFPSSEGPLIRITTDNDDLPVTTYDILDEYVPAGSNSVRVSQNAPLVPGSFVRVRRIATNEWFEDIGMDELTQNCGSAPICSECNDCEDCCNPDESWDADAPGTYDLVSERYVTRFEQADGVSGARVILDQPLMNALESKYGPHKLDIVSGIPARTRNVGVYNLRGVAHQSAPKCSTGTPRCTGGGTLTCDDEDQGACSSGTPCCDVSGSCESAKPYCTRSKTMINIGRAEDIWVKEVIASGFSYAAVDLGSTSRQVTVEDTQYRNPGGPISGGWRYPFPNAGQASLVINSFAELGRHDFVPGAHSAGPNAYVRSEAVSSFNDSGPHHRWGTGALFDNISITSPAGGSSDRGEIRVRNRLTSGTGHGWTGSSMVTWNSTADGYAYYSPPTGQNWLLGSQGPYHDPGTLSQNPLNPDDPYLRNSKGEAHPHFDFENVAEHGTKNLPDGLYEIAAMHQNPGGGTVRIEERHYYLGDPDDFGEDAGGDINDTVFVNPAWVAWLATQPPTITATRGFDSVDDHKSIPFTFRFDLASNEMVIHAWVSIRAKRVGAYTQDDWHHVQIGGAGSNNSEFANSLTYRYSCTTTPCQPVVPQEMAGPFTWMFGSTPVVRVLDLGSRLSFLNRTKTTPSGRRYGELNMNFHRRTRIDWASLTIVVRGNYT